LAKELDCDERTIRQRPEVLGDPGGKPPREGGEAEEIQAGEAATASNSNEHSAEAYSGVGASRTAAGVPVHRVRLEAAAGFLYVYRSEINDLPDSSLTAAELLSRAEPKQFDFNPDNPTRNEDKMPCGWQDGWPRVSLGTARRELRY
jgi:hypothetical protein